MSARVSSSRVPVGSVSSMWLNRSVSMGPAWQTRPMDHPLLDEAVRSAIAYIDSLPDRPVGRPADADALRRALGAPLTDEGDGNAVALRALLDGVEDVLVASAGPRYFGFVIG